MKFSVDKIEDNIVLLENIVTGLKKEEKIKNISFSIKEKDIIIFENNTYRKNDELKQKRIDMLKAKMNILRKK